DQEKRQALWLVLVLAERAGFGKQWRSALEGFDVTESQIVREWTAEARAEGVRAGETKGNVEMLLEVLKAKFGALPAAWEAAIRRTTERPALQRWGAQAARARTLQSFRQQAAL